MIKICFVQSLTLWAMKYEADDDDTILLNKQVKIVANSISFTKENIFNFSFAHNEHTRQTKMKFVFPSIVS